MSGRLTLCENDKATRRKVIIDACRSAGISLHLSKRPRRHDPVMQRLTARPERVPQTLARAGAISVEGNREVVDS